MQAEFSPLNCPLSPPPATLLIVPAKSLKNHLRNIKYFLLKGNLDSRSNLYNIQQSNFRNNTTKWYA